MRLFLKTVVSFILVLIFLALSGEIIVKPKLGDPPLKLEKYIYIDEKIPDYIIKIASEKNMGFAFELNDDGDWLKNNIEIITRNGVTVFIRSSVSKQQEKYIDELAKLTGYNIKIICYKGDCENENKWKHPLIKTSYFIKRSKNKEKEDLYFHGTGQKSKGEIKSVTGLNNFKEEPFIKSTVFFRDHRLGFVLIDEGERPSFIKDADTVIYFSKSEKKLKEFIEKKN